MNRTGLFIALGLAAFVAPFAWAKSTGVIDEPWVRLVLARVRARTDALRAMNLRMAWAMTVGRLNPAEASQAQEAQNHLIFLENFFDELRRQVDQSGQADAMAHQPRVNVRPFSPSFVADPTINPVSSSKSSLRHGS